MWQAQLLPPSHYKSHEFQFQVVVETLPTELEGYAWELSLVEQVELVVLDILPWILPKVSSLGK